MPGSKHHSPQSVAKFPGTAEPTSAKEMFSSRVPPEPVPIERNHNDGSSSTPACRHPKNKNLTTHQEESCSRSNSSSIIMPDVLTRLYQREMGRCAAYSCNNNNNNTMRGVVVPWTTTPSSASLASSVAWYVDSGWIRFFGGATMELFVLMLTFLFSYSCLLLLWSSSW